MARMPLPTAVLAQRLETLTGEDGACCALDARAEALRIAASRDFERAAARSRALGDERRLLAASMLKRRREMCACELQAALGLTHATVSHHMALLVDAGVVLAERRGKWIHYHLAPGEATWVP